METFTLVIFWIFTAKFGIYIFKTARIARSRKVEFDDALQVIRLLIAIWAGFLLWA